MKTVSMKRMRSFAADELRSLILRGLKKEHQGRRLQKEDKRVRKK